VLLRKGTELVKEIRDELIDMCAGVLEEMLDKTKNSKKAEDAMRYSLAACHCGNVLQSLYECCRKHIK